MTIQTFHRCDWPPNDTPVHPTKLDLDEKASPDNSDNSFGEANIETQTLAEPPRDSIDVKSEEKSEPDSNHQTNDPDCLLPSDLANLELKP